MTESAVVKVLKEGPSTVSEIVMETGAGEKTVRNHVNRMKDRGVVRVFGVLDSNTKIWELVES